MKLHWRRIYAITKKELRDFRRNRFIVATMLMLPLIFVLIPLVGIFSVKGTVLTHLEQTKLGISLLYMLLVPTLVPAALSAYSIVGERDQGTLEPILITPIRRDEFLLGKALAAFMPTIAIAYFVYAIFLAATGLFGQSGVANVIFQSSRLIIQLLYTPLLAGWSIWACIAISSRSSDVRVAQQLSTLASLPPLVVVALFATNAITPTPVLALGFGAILFVINVLGWKLVSGIFNGEKMITGKNNT